MASIKELTGGSADVNPQIFTVKMPVQPAANTVIRLTLPVPVVRNTASAPKGKMFAFELIQVKVNAIPGLAFPLAGADQNFEWAIGTGTGTPGPGNDGTFYQTQLIVAGAVGPQGFLDGRESDGAFTDNAGHGLIITNPQMTFEFDSIGLSVAQSALFRLFYRWKTIDITEVVTSTL